MGTLVSGGKARTNLEIERAAQSALLRRMRYCRRYTCNGLYRTPASHEVNPDLAPQQEQTDNRECDAEQPLPGGRLAKEQHTSNGHDGSAASKNCWDRRERAAFLEQQEECNCACANADSGKQRVTKTRHTKFLTRSSPKPKNRQIDQDRQCGAGFDNETAETFTNAFGCKTCEDLVRAVKNSGNDRIPKPSCHETNLGHEMDHSREN